jgi:hypothetical protein
MQKWRRESVLDIYDLRRQPAPRDDEVIASIRASAADISKAAGNKTGPGADAARNVSALLERLAGPDAATRASAEAAFIPPLVHDLDLLRKSLDPQRVTIKTLPRDLVGDWMRSDGRARPLEALPKGDSNATTTLRKFATAVLAAASAATGPAVALYQSGEAVTSAFIEAGALALATIAMLLFIALRRVADVLLTLFPLVLAGVTLEVCALAGIALNFANVVALPLLLGAGCIQNLLHHGLAGREDRIAAIDPDQGRGFQCNDQRSGVREYVVVKLSRHIEHG